MKLLQLVRTDLDRERKSRVGLKGLTQTLNSQENQNVTDKLYHVSVQNNQFLFLESHWKSVCIFLEF